VSQSTRQWLSDVTDKHPAGEFDSAYAKRKLAERFNLRQRDNMGDIFACMMAYQKMMNKEAREDRRMQSHMKRLMLASKEEKLKMDNERIDAGMKEAREKADAAMNAATTELVLAIASGLVQIGAAVGNYSAEGGEQKQKKDSLTRLRPVPVKRKLSVAEYIKKLEDQYAIIKKGGF
jgi:hypothetical protein